MGSLVATTNTPVTTASGPAIRDSGDVDISTLSGPCLDDPYGAGDGDATDGDAADGDADPKTSESSKRGSLAVQPAASAPRTITPSSNDWSIG